jgi:hypothetical protein
MPPEPGMPTITPAPAHLKQSKKKFKQSGPLLLGLLTLVFVGSYIYLTQYGGAVGSVEVLSRALTGERALYTLKLPSGHLSTLDGDANAITTTSNRLFREDDGSIITLDKVGIVRFQGGLKGPKSVLIASVREPSPSTPLAVWNKGARIAWVSPSDGSLQVFTKTTNGSYTPTYLNTTIRPNSLGFTADGNQLVLGVLGQTKTSIYTVLLWSKVLTNITTLDGYVSVVPTL